MSECKFKVKRLRWWNLPIPLYKKLDNGNWLKIGYVWNATCFAVKNANYGWIAFVEDQSQKNLDEHELWSCDHCGSEIGHTKRSRIKSFLESTKKTMEHQY